MNEVLSQDKTYRTVWEIRNSYYGGACIAGLIPESLQFHPQSLGWCHMSAVWDKMHVFRQPEQWKCQYRSAYVAAAVTWLGWDDRKVREIRAERCHAKWRRLCGSNPAVLVPYSKTASLPDSRQHAVFCTLLANCLAYLVTLQTRMSPLISTESGMEYARTKVIGSRTSFVVASVRFSIHWNIFRGNPFQAHSLEKSYYLNVKNIIQNKKCKCKNNIKFI